MEVVSRGDGRWVEARPPRPSSPVPRAGLRIDEHGSIGALRLERQRIARSDDGRHRLGRAPLQLTEAPKKDESTPGELHRIFTIDDEAVGGRARTHEEAR